MKELKKINPAFLFFIPSFGRGKKSYPNGKNRYFQRRIFIDKDSKQVFIF